VELPHSGAVMHYSEYAEPRDGAVSVKESCECGVFRMKITAVKGSCL
jgi:nicotinamide mononucleotide (NMN) deamidase PncC